MVRLAVEAFGVDRVNCFYPFVFLFQEMASGGGLKDGYFSVLFKVVVCLLYEMLIY